MNLISLEDKAIEMLTVLKCYYPEPNVGFPYRDPFKTLIATLLSAQSTDKQTGPAVESLFEQYPTISDISSADIKDIQEIIRSVGLFRSKAKYVKLTAQKLVEIFKSRVPDTMEELTGLPGVGRKTANLVISKAFSKNVGIAVDTHVFRISRKLGIAKSSIRDNVEKELMSIYPSDDYLNINTYFIKHGRKICTARKPKCDICPLNELCEYYSKSSSCSFSTS